MWRLRPYYKDQVTVTFTEEQWEVLERDCMDFIEKHYEKVEE